MGLFRACPRPALRALNLLEKQHNLAHWCHFLNSDYSVLSVSVHTANGLTRAVFPTACVSHTGRPLWYLSPSLHHSSCVRARWKAGLRALHSSAGDLLCVSLWCLPRSFALCIVIIEAGADCVSWVGVCSPP